MTPVARRRSRMRLAQRDVSFIANLLRAPVFRLRRWPVVSMLEDRRAYHPEGIFRSSLRVAGSRSRVVAGAVSGSADSDRSFVGDRFKFVAPVGVSICVRRKQRREVLFAFNKMRSGAGRGRRRNYYSAVSCKR